MIAPPPMMPFKQLRSSESSFSCLANQVVTKGYMMAFSGWKNSHPLCGISKKLNILLEDIGAFISKYFVFEDVVKVLLAHELAQMDDFRAMGDGSSCRHVRTNREVAHWSHD
jgi:hypothetical protein